MTPVAGRRSARHRAIPLLGLAVLLCGCASSGPDYAALEEYYRTAPRTILILPVQNETTEAEAPEFFLSTIGTPLIDRGYYVIPAHLLDDVLAHEGLDLAGESWEIEPVVLHRYFGADAVLYVTIQEWDTNYRVLKSWVTVALRYRLVDTRTGAVLWEYSGRKVIESSDTQVSGGGLAGLVVALIVNSVDAAVTAATVRYVTIASDVNRFAFGQLPVGVYHAGYAEIQAGIARWKEEQARAVRERAGSPDGPGSP
jgi:hypothetical protein